MNDETEPERVRERYARRPPADGPDWRYHRLNPAALLASQERERGIARLLRDRGWLDLPGRRAVEVGSGGGDNLIELLRFGFAPEHLRGIELLPERHAAARRRLPEGVRLDCGDALAADVPDAGCDLVVQSTVFSSLLDDAFQERLAAAMWRWLVPGGAVLWYDFTVDNPANRDVRGVPLARVRSLFPDGLPTHRRVTLAPPVARRVCRIHPGLYTLLNRLPLLRTHLLCWIEKPAR